MHPKNKLNKLEQLVKQTEDAVVQPINIQKEAGSNPIEVAEAVKRPKGRPKGSQNKNIGYRKKDADAMAKAAKVLWERGIVNWKLDRAQMDLYNSYKNRKGDELVWVVTRQAIGKSFCAAVIGTEECMNNPGLRVAYISPQKAQTRDVVEKNMIIILQDCPEALRPKYDSQRAVWKFPNGSIMKVAGIDGGHIDSLRGQTFDRVFIDEAGFPSAEEFVYAMESVVYPTMTRADHPVMLMFSTPPKTFDHPFNDYWDKAAENGNLVFKTIYDSCLPRYQIEQIEEKYGIDSPAFKREYLCERLADSSSLVIPEATPDTLLKIVTDHKRPEFFRSYTTADYGVMDLNAVLFGYHDFVENKLVIEDELVLAGQDFDTDKMAKAIKTKEIELWGEDIQPQRYCDNNLQIIRDFNNLHRLIFLATQKDNKNAAINQVRMKIQSLEIIINPRCKNLISHIKNATWDKTRKNFRRSLGHHYDFLDALIYMVRNVDYGYNPYPPGYHLKGDFISPKFEGGKGTRFEKFLKDLTRTKNVRYREKS